MTGKNSNHLKEITVILVLWLVMTGIFMFIKLGDMPVQYLQAVTGKDAFETRMYIVYLSIDVALPLGIIFGVIYSYLYPWLYRTQGFITNILVRIIVLITISLSVLMFLRYYSDFGPLLSKNSSGIFTYLLLTEMLIG